MRVFKTDKNEIIVAVLQIMTKSGCIDENLIQAFDLADQAVAKGAQLLVYPELSLTGYHLEEEKFRMISKRSHQYLEDFRAYAKAHHVVMVVPYIGESGDDIFISAAVIESDGEILVTYNKSFLWGVEQTRFTHGSRNYKAFDTSLGRMGLLICYDIEFPEPSRILAFDGAHVLIVPSVWSIPAVSRWDIQLPARALDNTFFVIGANTVGEGSCGKSKVIAPNGDMLCQASHLDQQVLLCTLEGNLIDQTRECIPYLKEYDMQLFPHFMLLHKDNCMV